MPWGRGLVRALGENWFSKMQWKWQLPQGNEFNGNCLLVKHRDLNKHRINYDLRESMDYI